AGRRPPDLVPAGGRRSVRRARPVHRGDGVGARAQSDAEGVSARARLSRSASAVSPARAASTSMARGSDSKAGTGASPRSVPGSPSNPHSSHVSTGLVTPRHATAGGRGPPAERDPPHRGEAGTQGGPQKPAP